MFSAIHYHPSSADIERGYRNLAAVLLYYSGDKQELPGPNRTTASHHLPHRRSIRRGATKISVSQLS